ncbi:hypothetical protein M405DRAFT_615899 [Rhizopogon salebrosus TDB-379]|nr:hypothetical protein M405DRAFT_615899 [Rhizopogon salebrosus TDB-379]
MLEAFPIIHNTSGTLSPTTPNVTSINTFDTSTKSDFVATRNGRNFCAHPWLKQLAPHGSLHEFKRYRDSLGKERQQKYDAEATKLVSEGTWSGNTVGVLSMFSAHCTSSGT